MLRTTIVTAAELVEHLDDPAWIVVDCRFSLADPGAGRRAWATAHIPGARYAHLDEDLSSPITATSGRHPLPDPARLAATLGAWGIDAGRQVVVYDDSAGAIAARLWWMLRWLGHDAVALLDGGFPLWEQQAYPVTGRVAGISPACFKPRERAGMYADTAEVEAGMESGALVLVDARAPERFRGVEEPIDPVAGHVPGAVNLPYTWNLDAAGCLRRPEELATLYNASGSGQDARPLVHMCGSGVTACLNILAQELAGVPGALLYPGSWSEWIRDPDRPVATGG